MINARSETITEKPFFKRAASKGRAILPADGYFEWQKNEHGKTPYFLRGFLHGNGVLAMAGLYELWPNPDLPEDHPNKWLWTTTVLTRPAQDALGRIHDRSPVILPETFWEYWLDPALNRLEDVGTLRNSVPEPHRRTRAGWWR